jgi:hypothetical protein
VAVAHHTADQLLVAEVVVVVAALIVLVATELQTGGQAAAQANATQLIIQVLAVQGLLL